MIVRSLLVILGGGICLGLANSLAPSLSRTLAIVIGIIVTGKVYLALGKLNWKRDLQLGLVFLLIITLAYLIKRFLCTFFLPGLARCAESYFRGDLFSNLLTVGLPIVLFGSWFRFRSLKQRSVRPADETTPNG